MVQIQPDPYLHFTDTHNKQETAMKTLFILSLLVVGTLQQAQTFDTFDTNSDGAVSLAEVLAYCAKQDSNHDGNIEFGEYAGDQAHNATVRAQFDFLDRMGGAADHNIVCSEASKAFITAADSNNDGQVQGPEFAAFVTKMFAAMSGSQTTFATFDTNTDGAVTLAEVLAYCTKQDSNHDGHIEFGEYAGDQTHNATVRAQFDYFDKMGGEADHNIVCSEVSKAFITAADTNSDGQVQGEEFAAFLTKMVAALSGTLPAGK